MQFLGTILGAAAFMGGGFLGNFIVMRMGLANAFILTLGPAQKVPVILWLSRLAGGYLWITIYKKLWANILKAQKEAG